MADELEPEGRPVLVGLLALVGVGLAVGLVIGGVALAGTRVLGLGDDASTATATDEASMYLPRPERTDTPSGPLTTLNTAEPDEGEDDPSGSGSGDGKQQDEDDEETISLSASQTEVAPMGQIDLTGTYPRGEGAVLQVERKAEGSWQEFPVTAVVSGGVFTTYVQTSSPGVNKFRVVDNETGESSNTISVRIG